MKFHNTGKKTVSFAMRASIHLGLIATFFLSLPSTSFSGTFVAFGPEGFLRGTGKPTPVTNNFPVADLHVAYMLRIDNGGQIGEFANVSSAVITLNGVDIVKPNEFNQNITVIEKPVTLLAENELVVELRSKPGSDITLQIIGIRPEVDITAPANLSIFGAGPIAVSGPLRDGAVEVEVKGIPASVENETFITTVPLQEGNNTITAVARDIVGNVGTDSIQVTLDTRRNSLARSQPLWPVQLGRSTTVPGSTSCCARRSGVNHWKNFNTRSLHRSISLEFLAGVELPPSMKRSGCTASNRRTIGDQVKAALDRVGVLLHQ